MHPSAKFEPIETNLDIQERSIAVSDVQSDKHLWSMVVTSVRGERSNEVRLVALSIKNSGIRCIARRPDKSHTFIDVQAEAKESPTSFRLSIEVSSAVNLLH